MAPVEKIRKDIEKTKEKISAQQKRLRELEAQLIEDPDAGIDFSRVVHADERFTHHRPIVAGDEITTVLHVDAVVERAGLAMVTTRCALFGDAALTDHVATVRSTLAVRGEDA